MDRLMLYSEKQLVEMCGKCRVPTSGAKLCRALELTAVGASPGGELLPNGRRDRDVPALFDEDLEWEIRDLCSTKVTMKTLKEVCTKRKMYNSCTKVGLAV